MIASPSRSAGYVRHGVAAFQDPDWRVWVGSGLPEFLKAAPETTSAESVVGGTAMAAIHHVADPHARGLDGRSLLHADYQYPYVIASNLLALTGKRLLPNGGFGETEFSDILQVC